MSKGDIMFGQNGDASVVYRHEDNNGDVKTSININGKEVDLTNPDEVAEAKKHIESLKSSAGSTFFKLFGINIDDSLDASIKALDGMHQKALEANVPTNVPEKDTVDWEEYGIDWMNEGHCIADLYLSENFDNYEDQEPEAQARQIKTLAAFYEWLQNRD